jgi:tetratricopeptide (TPR) repeat protein
MRQAVELASRGQTAQALTLLNTIQGEDGLPTTYFGLRGTLEARSAQFKAAEKDLTTALNRGLESADVLYTLGLVRLQLNQPAAARDALLRSVQMLPGRPEGWLALGQTYVKLHQRSQAIACFDKALALGSESAAICFGAGAAYEGFLEFAKAAHAFQSVSEIDSSHWIVRARCMHDLLRAGLSAEASQLAGKWRDDPAVTAPQHLEIGIVFADGRLYDDAAAEFQSALRTQPSMTEAKYNLALAYLFEQKYEPSAALAKELTAGTSASQAHEILGLIKEEQGDPMSARAEFSEAANHNPRSADALFQLGRADMQLGKLADAKREFSASSVACSEACTAPLIGLATAYKLESRYDEAVRTMKNAIGKSPLDAVNYLYLGDIEIRANQLPDAERTLLTAIRLDPQSALAHYMYAYALLKQHPVETPQAAIDSLEASIRLDPNSGLAYLRLGTILARRGDYMRAETLLADAVRLEPGLREAHLQYATVLKKLGQSELATKEIGQFQALTVQRYEEDLRMMHELRRLAPIAP